MLASCANIVGGVASPAPDLSSFVPSADDPDPSRRIDGVRIENVENAQHVGPGQRVAYTAAPPFGGNHDQAWAACNGVVYPEPVRSENLVHSLEHGAVWIAYDPDRVDAGTVDALAARVEGNPYLVLSPYPGMEQPISLQSWGHQLAVDDAADPRIDRFVTALRINPNTHPEFGASCDEVGRGYFDQDAPPPFVPPPGPDEIDGSAIVGE
ncbi:DUF3105 domain-containing protein [Pseudonocardia sp.]|uniref:DUF3105 domain-containing protein n=1 Tax=Pseudonocardia sp. TaxID=60912 RepID=UPI0026043CD6|nr:DUF3105 domain-containing protein [Pseudonocardia sp.]